MSNLIPYTHYAYFDDKAAADACAAELDVTFDCLTAVDEICQDGELEWQLRAARTIDVNAAVNWHDEIEPVVEQHGGEYDFGEACMFVPTSTGPQER